MIRRAEIKQNSVFVITLPSKGKAVGEEAQVVPDIKITFRIGCGQRSARKDGGFHRLHLVVNCFRIVLQSCFVYCVLPS